MAEAIGEYQASFSDKGRNNADVGQVPRSKRQRGLGPFELCKDRFEFFMRRKAAAYEARCAGAGPVLPGGGNRRLNDGRMRGESQIIVR